MWCGLAVFFVILYVLISDLFIKTVELCILSEICVHFVTRFVRFVLEFIPFVWKLGLKRRCDSLKIQVFSTFAYDHGRQLLRWSFLDYRP